jgi:hypothetical protein
MLADDRKGLGICLLRGARDVVHSEKLARSIF